MPTRQTQSDPEINREEVKEEIIYPRKVDSIINKSHTMYRKKRSGLVGAPNNVNVNDPTIKELADKGLKKFSENSEGSNEPMIVEIVEASKQVVSGLLYKIRVKLGTSNCPKGTKDGCQLKEGTEIKECLFTSKNTSSFILVKDLMPVQPAIDGLTTTEVDTLTVKGVNKLSFRIKIVLKH